MTSQPSPDAPRPAAGHVQLDVDQPDVDQPDIDQPDIDQPGTDQVPPGDDRLAQVRTGIDELGGRPLDEHVPTLSRALDAIVGELDELARSIPPAR